MGSAGAPAPHELVRRLEAAAPTSVRRVSLRCSHFLHHEDEGYMKVVRFGCPGYNNAQPKECPDFKYPGNKGHSEDRRCCWQATDASAAAVAQPPAPCLPASHATAVPGTINRGVTARNAVAPPGTNATTGATAAEAPAPTPASGAARWASAAACVMAALGATLALLG